MIFSQTTDFVPCRHRASCCTGGRAHFTHFLRGVDVSTRSRSMHGRALRAVIDSLSKSEEGSTAGASGDPQSSENVGWYLWVPFSMCRHRLAWPVESCFALYPFVNPFKNGTCFRCGFPPASIPALELTCGAFLVFVSVHRLLINSHK